MTTTIAFGGAATLLAARLTVIPLGALGCLALFACGAIVKDARVGTIAASLLMINPLYSLHAHRAMADVPCEAFMLSSLAVWLCDVVAHLGEGLAHRWAGSSLARRVCSPACRCSASSMVSSALRIVAAGMRAHLGGYPVFRSAANWRSPARRSSRSRVALAVAVAFNPYLTAKPSELARRHRPCTAVEKRMERFRQPGGRSARDLEQSEAELSPECPVRLFPSRRK